MKKRYFFDENMDVSGELKNELTKLSFEIGEETKNISRISLSDPLHSNGDGFESNVEKDMTDIWKGLYENLFRTCDEAEAYIVKS